VRVLLVSANFRPSVGGIERYVELLAQGLAERGSEVTVLCCRYGDAARNEGTGSLRIERVPATYVLKNRLQLHYPLPSPLPFGRRLRRLVIWADVVHVHDALYLTSGAALVAARRRTTRSVLTQHVAFTPQGSRGLDLVERGAIATLGRAARLATRVVAYNPAIAEWAERTWGLDNVALLPAGVPEPRAEDGDRASIRAELGLAPGRFTAVFVGRDVPTKRLDLVLAAGDETYDLVAVTDRAAPTAGADGVRVVPFMPPERLQRLLLAADAFVLPSRAEGIPLSLQEALLAGLPCILTRVPGFERYVSEEEAVWIEPTPTSLRAALRSLATDPARAAELGARAKTAGRREFSLDRFIDAHEHLYRDVLDGVRGRETPVDPTLAA
jgi:D-inositol-3-phosphate glycosyltransferase